jgi:hypothetical protein
VGERRFDLAAPGGGEGLTRIYDIRLGLGRIL